jgi:hypothetical protein
MAFVGGELNMKKVHEGTGQRGRIEAVTMEFVGMEAVRWAGTCVH